MFFAFTSIKEIELWLPEIGMMEVGVRRIFRVSLELPKILHEATQRLDRQMHA